jgi:predicted acyl esterase
MSIALRQPLYADRHLKNVLSPMADGVHLAADLLLPDSPGPFSAVFEFLPYRKDDRTAKTQFDCKPDSRYPARNRATKGA